MKLKAAVNIFLKLERSPLTTRNYQRILETLAAAIGPERQLGRITFEDLADYLQPLRETLKPSTLHTYVNTYKAFFNWCVKQHWIERAPTEFIKVIDPGSPPVSRPKIRTASSVAPSGASQNSRVAFVEKKYGSPSVNSWFSNASHFGHTRTSTCSQ